MDTYFYSYHICNIVFYVLFGLSFALMLFKIILHIVSLLPAIKFPETKNKHRYAIVIPARNESKVIAQILDSIQAQTYDKDLIDTFVIVESEEDPTCEIAKAYPRTHIFVRQHLELKGKGHALDELFGSILADENNKFEAYFIFDADNVLYPTYIEEMNKVYDQGYDVAVAYRNSKNWNDNWISACSGLTFSMFNTFDNRPRSRLGLMVTIMGTGFYISHKIISELGGYKFFTLTEDYELKLYSILNDVKSTYCEDAKFYDEQPTKLKVSWKQRMRWCKGFAQANKLYAKKIAKTTFKGNTFSKITSFSVISIVVTLASILGYQVVNLVLMFVGIGLGHPMWYKPAIGFVASGIALYLFLCLYTALLIFLNRKEVHLNFGNLIGCILANPVFIFMYIPIYISASLKKEVKWVPIEHNKTLEGEN